MSSPSIVVVFFQGMARRWDQVMRVVACRDPLFTAAELSPPPQIDQPWWRMHFAQRGDIDNLRLRGVGDIAFGISRGAATTFARWALDGGDNNAEGGNSSSNGEDDSSGSSNSPSRIRPCFLLLEGCPDSFPSVIRWRYGRWIGGIIELVLSAFTYYSRSEARRLAPLTLASTRFPLDLPVAFVTSKRDERVPPEGTARLAEALRARGHKHVHVLVLEDADHESYYTGSERDQLAYKQFVRTMRDKYAAGR